MGDQRLMDVGAAPENPVTPEGPSESGAGRPGPAARVLRNYGPPVVLLFALLALWQGLAVWLHVQPYLVPRPTDIARTMWDERGLLAHHSLATLHEVVFGFGLALGVGGLMAVLIAESSLARRAVYPLIVGSQTIPVIAIAPVVIIWFGFGNLSKVVVSAFISFFPIVVNASSGLMSLGDDFVKLMRSLPATRRQIFFKARLPASLPFVFAGMKISVVLAVIGAVVGEWVGSDAGLGHFILESNAALQTTRVFAAIGALSIMGVGLFVVVAVLERLAIPWHYQATKPEGV